MRRKCTQWPFKHVQISRVKSLVKPFLCWATVRIWTLALWVRCTNSIHIDYEFLITTHNIIFKSVLEAATFSTPSLCHQLRKSLSQSTASSIMYERINGLIYCSPVRDFIDILHCDKNDCLRSYYACVCVSFKYLVTVKCRFGRGSRRIAWQGVGGSLTFKDIRVVQWMMIWICWGFFIPIGTVRWSHWSACLWIMQCYFRRLRLFLKSMQFVYYWTKDTIDSMKCCVCVLCFLPLRLIVQTSFTVFLTFCLLDFLPLLFNLLGIIR